MEQKINLKFKENIPIKYCLNLYRILPDYPTKTDFLVDVIQYIARVCEVKQKEFNINDLKFSAKTLKYIFSDSEITDSFRERLKTIIKAAMDEGEIVKKGEFLYINKAVFHNIYQ